MKTLDYYNKNYKDYISSTEGIDLTSIQDEFLSLLEPNSYILDLGCGSGRDSLYFKSKGHRVLATDGSEMFVGHAKLLGLDAKELLFNDLDEEDLFDAVWACASILHLPKDQLYDAILRIDSALKPNGICYCSFKYGNFEGYKEDRYYSNFDIETFSQFIKPITDLAIIKFWTSKGALTDGTTTEWLNLILKKG